MPEVTTAAPETPLVPTGTVSPDAGDELLIKPDEAAPAPAAELKPQEKPKVETKTEPKGEAEPKAEPKVPPGYVPAEELRRLQSALDRREAATRRENEELRRRAEAQSLEGQIASFRDAVIKRLTENNVDPTHLAPYIEQAAQEFRANFANAQRNQELTTRLTETERLVASLQSGGRGVAMTSWVAELARVHRLDDADVAILNGYFNPDVVADYDQFVQAGNNLAGLAERLGNAKKAAAAEKKAALERVPAGQTFEQPTGSGGLTDAQYIKASNAGTVPFDAQKLSAAMKRMGYED